MISMAIFRSSVMRETAMAGAIRIGILTISDKGSVGEREDRSGPLIREVVAEIGAQVLQYEIVPDERPQISSKLAEWADAGELDLIITTGGTGLGARDVTPEATLDVLDMVVPGFGEAMRMEGLKKTPVAILSRGVGGVRAKAVIINLPGSPRGAQESLEAVLLALSHAAEMARGRVGDHAVDMA